MSHGKLTKVLFWVINRLLLNRGGHKQLKHSEHAVQDG